MQKVLDMGVTNEKPAGSWFLNCWQAAAYQEEIVQPFLARTIADEPLLFFRTQDEGVTALHDICPHRAAPLSLGTRVGDEIVCKYHGMRFGPGGKCTSVPGRNSIPAAANARSFPTVERWGILWVWMGNPASADEALLPDLYWLEDDNWCSVHGYLKVGADYRLLNDNLLDLTHESFLHSTSIGNSREEAIANYPAKVSNDGRVVKVERLMKSIDIPPTFAKLTGSSGKIDRMQRAIHMAPGINVTDVELRTYDSESHRDWGMRVTHLLTPATRTSTHYFIINSRNYELQNSPLDIVLEQIGYRVAGEDKAMLEMQQSILDAHPEIPVPRFAWAVDEAPVKARRMLDRLIAAENADSSVVARPKSLFESRG
jgi:phenylpropionate dioxygenase-like ring-hydroxylating dioxygenase large terminal subunit